MRVLFRSPHRHLEDVFDAQYLCGEEVLRTPEQQPTDEIETYALSPGWDRNGWSRGLPPFLQHFDRPLVYDQSEFFTAWDRSGQRISDGAVLAKSGNATSKCPTVRERWRASSSLTTNAQLSGIALGTQPPLLHIIVVSNQKGVGHRGCEGHRLHLRCRTWTKIRLSMRGSGSPLR